MVRKLELEALANDLGAVQTLLSRRTPDSDPIGYMQFASRVTEIEQSIHELAATPQNKASLAMFFAGEPVQGSRGVNADFAGKAIGLFPDLVSKQFASTERGSLAQTGPIPMKSNSDMLLTNIARGSVGLILEEADRNDSLTESELAVELALTGEGETIHGNVSREFASAHLEAIRATDDVVNRDWVVRVMVRTIKRPGKTALVKYTLKGLVRPVAPAN